MLVCCCRECVCLPMSRLPSGCPKMRRRRGWSICKGRQVPQANWCACVILFFCCQLLRCFSFDSRLALFLLDCYLVCLSPCAIHLCGFGWSIYFRPTTCLLIPSLANCYYYPSSFSEQICAGTGRRHPIPSWRYRVSTRRSLPGPRSDTTQAAGASPQLTRLIYCVIYFFILFAWFVQKIVWSWRLCSCLFVCLFVCVCVCVGLFPFCIHLYVLDDNYFTILVCVCVCVCVW